jgi:drug/metabolite transporter (DMT)-like permease
MTHPGENTNNKKLLGGLYSFIVSFTFCVHFFVAKDVLHTITPTMLGAVRGVVGGLILYLMFFTHMKGTFSLKNVAMLLSIAFFGYFINQVLFLEGLKRSTPLNTAVIMNTIPIVTAIMAMIVRVEHFSWRKLLGCMLGFSMIASLIIFTSHSELAGSKLGNTLIFSSVITLCIATTQTKQLVKSGFPSTVISATMLFVGGLGLYAFVIGETETLIAYSISSYANFAKMAFEIVIATSLIYLLSFKSLKYLSPSQSMIFIYLQPVMAAGIDFFMFDKVPPWVLAPVFLGVLISGYLVMSADTH